MINADTSYKDIKDMLVGTIGNAYPNVDIFTEEIKQGLIAPCFHVDLTRFESFRQGEDVYKYDVYVGIKYFPQDKLKIRSECYTVQQNMDILLNDMTHTTDRGVLKFYPSSNVMSQIIDNVLILNFKLTYYQYLTITDDDIKMLELKQKTEVK